MKRGRTFLIVILHPLCSLCYMPLALAGGNRLSGCYSVAIYLPGKISLTKRDTNEIAKGYPACQAESVRNSATRSSAAWRMSDRKSTRLNSSHLGISYAVF